MSAAASAADEPATGPLFSDRTDDTDKTITRYSVPSHKETKLRGFPHNNRAIMAKIKLPEKAAGMLLF